MSDLQTYEQAEDQALAEFKEEPLSTEEYLEELWENPSIASQSAKYLLEAIEHEGTRTVIEEGEEKERYRFFDDPNNNGEHAILGNTETLNDFVDDLRNIAAERGKDEKIVWIDGPTATGKSELKRNLINGLREYSKTEEGKRYTVEWNITGRGESSDPAMGTGGSSGSSGSDHPNYDDTAWYESPIQDEPLKLFSEDGVRQDILDDLNEKADDNIPIRIDGDIDPFSRAAYEELENFYLAEGYDDELFSKITDNDHVRIKRYLMDKSQGIGVLHAEDEGRPQQKLVGQWMQSLFKELDSKGKKDPRAHSYDGIVSQGHRGVTIIEDAIQHAKTVKKLLNIPEEGSVKLDKSIEMDVDTLFLMISNPDLEANVLDKKQQAEQEDPLRALRRRMEKHTFNYLTNYSLENDLIRREITNRTGVWERSDNYDELEDHIESPLRLRIRDQDGEEHEKEYAPHALEAAAMYNIISRLNDDIDLDVDDIDEDDLTHSSFNLIDKALLYDKGSLERDGHRFEKDDFKIDKEGEGKTGIPVTYTRDEIVSLLQQENNYSHDELDVENVIMPQDVIAAIKEGMKDEPLFNDQPNQENISEVARYEELATDVEMYIESKQEDDVIQAIMTDKETDKSTVEKYVRHLQADLKDDETVTIDGQKRAVDHDFLKSFETKTLGKFDSEEDYESDNKATEPVKEWRQKNINSEITNQILNNYDEDTTIDDIDLMEIPVFESLLGTHDWNDVHRFYEDLDPSDWKAPKTDTETEEVKEQTIETMVEEMGYSEASAEITSRIIMEYVENNESKLLNSDS